jgi:hypothetical protein
LNLGAKGLEKKTTVQIVVVIASILINWKKILEMIGGFVPIDTVPEEVF